MGVHFRLISNLWSVTMNVGCAFIKYPTREMATAAITGLNSIYVMQVSNSLVSVLIVATI